SMGAAWFHGYEGSAKALVSEAIWTAFILVYNFAMDTHPSLRLVSILERDVTLSHPYIHPETVPTYLLIILALGMPLLIMLACILLAAAVRPRGRGYKAWVMTYFWCALALCQALLLAGTITETVKLAVGRPRPNFFAYCNYAGYRDALASGDFTAYNAATNPQAFADMTKCTASASNQRSSITSFISGHASTSFAGCVFLFIFLRHFFRIPQGNYFSLEAAAACAPIIVSAWIAITRFRDRFHFVEDILGGALVGAICAAAAWAHMAAAKRHVPAQLPDSREDMTAATSAHENKEAASTPSGAAAHHNPASLTTSSDVLA
ncbi:phosphatase PAP2 family protein, partial [archaeon]